MEIRNTSTFIWQNKPSVSFAIQWTHNGDAWSQVVPRRNPIEVQQTNFICTVQMRENLWGVSPVCWRVLTKNTSRYLFLNSFRDLTRNFFRVFKEVLLDFLEEFLLKLRGIWRKGSQAFFLQRFLLIFSEINKWISSGVSAWILSKLHQVLLQKRGIPPGIPSGVYSGIF